LVSAPDRFPAGIEMQRLSEEPMVFVCRPDLHLAHRRHVAISELAAEDLIGFPAEFGLRRLVDGAFTAAGVTAHTPYEVALEYSVAAGLVRHGLGTIFMGYRGTPIPRLRAFKKTGLSFAVIVTCAVPSHAAPVRSEITDR
jgi:DNA-binding transcriptional LysR family regulator